MTLIPRRMVAVLMALLPALILASGDQSQWIRPPTGDAALVWGLKDGLVFGLPSTGGMGGPRGLIRVGIMGKSGKPELINFIAIEPVVKGPGPRNHRISLSELEMSSLDHEKRGKRLWTTAPRGNLTSRTENGRAVERLSVRIEVERFDKGPHVYLVATVASDRPQELALQVYNHEDSAPIEELTVTATMGNYERLRLLWLKGRTVDSRELYSNYVGSDFVEMKTYPLSEMLTYQGDALAIATPNETDPASVQVAAKSHWTYTSPRLTQYWRVPIDDIQSNLRVRVNGRRVYWQSRNEIPGGIAFENFEIRQTYKPGQAFIFGLNPLQPWEWTPAIPGLTAKPE